MKMKHCDLKTYEQGVVISSADRKLTEKYRNRKQVLETSDWLLFSLCTELAMVSIRDFNGFSMCDVFLFFFDIWNERRRALQFFRKEKKNNDMHLWWMLRKWTKTRKQNALLRTSDYSYSNFNSTRLRLTTPTVNDT